MNDGANPFKPTFDPTANARTRSEAATLALAVSVAVALGVACGLWINARLASAASAGRAAAEQPAPAVAAEPRPVEHGNHTPPTIEAKPTQDSVETADAGTDLKGRTDAGRALQPVAPAAREASPPAKPEVRQEIVPGGERGTTSGREQGRAAPCALYASAGSLTVRGGGATPLVLGGPGESGRVSVNTPDWSNIAVLYEGRTGNGWMRYTVRSVSNRPGVYAVRFITPCGSKTIPVTVTRP
jgi:hypothetical protein